MVEEHCWSGEEDVHFETRSKEDGEPNAGKENWNVTHYVHEGEDKHGYCSLVLQFLSFRSDRLLLTGHQHESWDESRGYDGEEGEGKANDGNVQVYGWEWRVHLDEWVDAVLRHGELPKERDNYGDTNHKESSIAPNGDDNISHLNNTQPLDQLDGSENTNHQNEVYGQVDERFPRDTPHCLEQDIVEQQGVPLPTQHGHAERVRVEGDPCVSSSYNHVNSECCRSLLLLEHEEGEQVEGGPEQDTEQRDAAEELVNFRDWWRHGNVRHIGLKK